MLTAPALSSFIDLSICSFKQFVIKLFNNYFKSFDAGEEWDGIRRLNQMQATDNKPRQTQAPFVLTWYDKSKVQFIFPRIKPWDSQV